MDFRNNDARNNDHAAQDRAQESEPTFLEKLTEYAKEEAMGKVVETLSGGWLTMEHEDADEPEPRQRGDSNESFDQRLQRRLAELQAEGSPPVDDAPVRAPPAPVAVHRPARPPLRRPGGFGRKGL